VPAVAAHLYWSGNLVHGQ